MAKINNPTKVITGPDTRWSYCNACVARYRAFKRAVSLGNTLLCLFRRR